MVLCSPERRHCSSRCLDVKCGHTWVKTNQAQTGPMVETENLLGPQLKSEKESVTAGAQ